MTKIIIIESLDNNFSQSFEVSIPYDSHHRELDLGQSLHHILNHSMFPNWIRTQLYWRTSDILLRPSPPALLVRRYLSFQVSSSHRIRLHCLNTNNCQNQTGEFKQRTWHCFSEGPQRNPREKKKSERKNYQRSLRKSFRMERTSS